ncbi:MAG: molybdopterin cofactor-binding domain-containing protein [Planctomycetota bacterium]
MGRVVADPTRRTVLKMAWGAVTVAVTPIPAMGWGRGRSPEPLAAQPGGWSGGPGEARYRIDGLAKVLGHKIYARDFRSRDMPGWPDNERVAMVLHAAHTDRILERYDLSMLPDELRPMRTVDAADLARDQVADLFPDTSPKGWPPGFLAATGQQPLYLGQPVAILIFESADVYRRAHRLLQFRDDVVRYGSPVPPRPIEGPYPSPNYLTYVDGEFSRVKDGPTDPFDPKTPEDRQAVEWRAEIRSGLIDWRTDSGSRSTQRIVPMFMEPESGLGWLNGHTLRMVLGTQAPNGDVQDGLQLFAAEGCPIRVDEVELVSCYPGGGFGGRDVSPFTPTLMLAAAYADGPVRMAYDRFAQFQVGLTQIPARFEVELAGDDEHRFQALVSTVRMTAGGKNNYSQFVADLAGYSAGGAYFFPRAIVDASAEPSPDVVAGSMRGFGGVQAAFALETMVENYALSQRIDPIELRRRNALKEGDRTITGAPLTEPMRIAEICERAAANPLWVEREARARREENDGKLYGVGFALANQAYGTGSDGVMASLALEQDGSIVARTTAVDMGQGSATGLALAPARWLGSNASNIEMGRVAIFSALQLSTTASTGDAPTHRKHAPHDFADSPWDDPHYTASLSMSSSACITAFQQFHAVSQAASVLFEIGVWPAAVRIWGVDPGPRARRSARWYDGELCVDDLAPLPLPLLAREIYERDGIAEAMVHAYFAGAWVEASYEVEELRGRWPIDGLATRNARSTDFLWRRRSDVKPPPPGSKNYGRSLYSPSGTLVALTVDPGTAAVELLDIHTYLDAGKVHQPDLVSGQYQGGAAMGVGYALLEDATHGPDGPGGGRWNLNRYHVPLATDLPLDRIRLELLPPVGEHPTGKGIAEAVLCPIAPAIANALTAATGGSFPKLPITTADIREALRS